jgi:hypothetical protein
MLGYALFVWYFTLSRAATFLEWWAGPQLADPRSNVGGGMIECWWRVNYDFSIEE